MNVPIVIDWHRTRTIVIYMGSASVIFKTRYPIPDANKTPMSTITVRYSCKANLVTLNSILALQMNRMLLEKARGLFWYWHENAVWLETVWSKSGNQIIMAPSHEQPVVDNMNASVASNVCVAILVPQNNWTVKNRRKNGAIRYTMGRQNEYYRCYYGVIPGYTRYV